MIGHSTQALATQALATQALARFGRILARSENCQSLDGVIALWVSDDRARVSTLLAAVLG